MSAEETTTELKEEEKKTKGDDDKSSDSSSDEGSLDDEDEIEKALNSTSIKDVLTMERINRRLDLAFKGVGYVTWDAWDSAIKISLASGGLAMSEEGDAGDLWVFAAILNLIVVLIAAFFIFWDRYLFAKYLVPDPATIPREKRAAAKSFSTTVDTVTDILVYWAASSITQAVDASFRNSDDRVMVVWVYFGIVTVASIIVILGIRHMVRKLLHLVRRGVEKALIERIDRKISSVDMKISDSEAARLVRQETFNKLANLMRGSFAWLGALALVNAVKVTLVRDQGLTDEELEQNLLFLWIFVLVSWVVTAIILFAMHRSNVKLFEKKCKGDKRSRASVLTDVVLEKVVTELRSFFSSLLVNVSAISFRDASFLSFLVIGKTSEPDPWALLAYFGATLCMAMCILSIAEVILSRFERGLEAKKARMEEQHKRLLDDDEGIQVLFEVSLIELYSNIIKLLSTGFGLIVGGAFASFVSELLHGKHLESVEGLWIYAIVTGLLFFVFIPLARMRLNRALCKLSSKGHIGREKQKKAAAAPDTKKSVSDNKEDTELLPTSTDYANDAEAKIDEVAAVTDAPADTNGVDLEESHVVLESDAAAAETGADNDGGGKS